MSDGLARFSDKRGTGRRQHHFSCSALKESIAKQFL
jgi:hypothetical protein